MAIGALGGADPEKARHDRGARPKLSLNACGSVGKIERGRRSACFAYGDFAHPANVRI
jgi:hypothetical protein